MIKTPEYFRSKIRRAFGEKGQQWLTDLPQTSSECINKWKLTDLTVVDNLSFNLVVYARSADYGDVVLKIGVPHPELYTEMQALSLYDGGDICKCYQFDMDLGAMLLEKIEPGYELITLEDKKSQLTAAADLIYKLPIPIADNTILPTYGDWMDKAFARAREENKVGDRMLTYIDIADSVFSDIVDSDYEKTLLHGDLHHWNILQTENGNWKAIDPKGVIGPAFMESARFIDNHIGDAVNLKDYKFLDETIAVFSRKFKQTKMNIAHSLFILCVLSTCWTYEEADPDPGDLRNSENVCTFVYKYINKLS